MLSPLTMSEAFSPGSRDVTHGDPRAGNRWRVTRWCRNVTGGVTTHDTHLPTTLHRTATLFTQTREPTQDLSPSNSSSKSSTKNSFSGGRFGRFRVLRSCWILEDTLLFTGTPATGRGALSPELANPLETGREDGIQRPTRQTCWNS